jgi:hypothetical protein
MPSRQSYQLSEEEIRAAQLANAYDVIGRLRPHWLRTRGQPGAIRVYYNLSPVGGITALRQISTTGLTSIQFLNGPDALIRFGRGHEEGAILVSSR